MKTVGFHSVLGTMVVLLLGLIALAASTQAQSPGDMYTTYHGDLARTGWNTGETILTHDNIDNRAGQGRFGKLWDRGFTHTPEQVYAAPLYYKGAVFAATERNWVYALNADDGSVIWQRPLALDLQTPDPALNQSQYLGCGDISPWHGVTGTPVLDPDTETLYVVDVTLGAGNQQLYRMYALDIYTGTTRAGWPVTLGGTYRGRTFDATRVTQRGALTMLADSTQAKWVYATFSSRCDFGGWNGWIIGVNTENPSQPTRIFCTSPDGNGAGVWGGAGISVDEDGFMYVATGNGTFNGANPNPPNRSFAQSVLRLDPESPDFFDRSPANYYTLPNVGPTNSRDEDLGGSSVLIIPDQSDTPTDTPRMLLTSGKDGVLYLLNRDNLGGYAPPNGSQNGSQIQRLKLYLGDGSGGAKVAAAYFDAGEQGRFIYMAAGRNNQFIGNYAHFGDSSFGIGAGGSARAAIGTGPALAAHNGQIFAAWVSNDGSRSILIKSSTDGRNWSAPAPVSATADLHSSPALAAFNNRLALAWIDRQTRALMLKLSDDGGTWPAEGRVVSTDVAAFSSPSLAVFNNRLYVSWIAETVARDIVLKSSADGMDWSGAEVPIYEGSDHTNAVAALGALDGRLYVFWVMTNPGPPKTERRIFYKSSADGTDWETDPRQSTGDAVRSESGITVAVFNDLRRQPRLHCLWIDNGGQNPQIRNRSLGRDLVTGNFGLESISTGTNENSLVGSGLGAAAFNGNLHMVFISNNSNRDVLTKIAQPAFPGRGVVALKLVVENGKSKLDPVWATPYTLNYQPGAPYVSSNGQSDPVVWVADPAGSRAVVRAYDAITGEELYNSERRSGGLDRPGWAGRKFGKTVVVDGKVFIGTEGITAYGMLPE